MKPKGKMTSKNQRRTPPTNLTIAPKLKEHAMKLATSQEKSLTQLVEEGLRLILNEEEKRISLKTPHK